MTRTAIAFFLVLTIARAQPAIGQNGVVNSASRIPPTLAGGAIARGARFTIFGVRLGTRGHTRVILSSGKQSTDALVLSVSVEEIEAQMPAPAPVGKALLRVIVDGQASRPFPVEIAAFNPGLFSRNGQGWGPGRIENIAADGAGSENSTTNPAHPGQRIAMTGTGFGNLRSVTVVVGGRKVKAARRSEESLEFKVPAAAPEGCYVPVYALASRDRASNAVTIAIRSGAEGAGACRPAVLPFDAGSIALGILSRSRMMPRSEVADTLTDEATVVVAKTSGHNQEPSLAPLLLVPPAGSCTTYTSSFQADGPLPNSLTASLVALLGGRGMDAGPELTVSGSGQNRILRRENGVPGYYRAGLGQSGPGASRRALPLFLDPGEVTLRGADFEVRAMAPKPFEWVNRGGLAIIDRSRPLTILWSDPSPEHTTVILASNVDQITTAAGACLCAARSGDGRFTIPAAMLANIPVSRGVGGIPYDQLYVLSLGERAEMRVPGISAGAVVSVYSIGRLVVYR